MTGSMFLGMFDWIADFFKALFDLIPKIMYLLYTSLASVIDILQLFFRKLAGLDVYYVEGKAVTGDLVTNFITGILGINKDNLAYSALSTVFWSMIVFGVIVCFAATIIAIIKSHYTYDEKSAKGPMQYVYTAGKAIINMVAVPVIVVLGLYVSEALLTALDTITSTNNGTISQMYGDKVDRLVSVDTVKGATTKENEKTYIFYDIFGWGGKIAYNDSPDPVAKFFTTDELKELTLIGAKNETFSGSLFKTAAYNANRARLMGSKNAIDPIFKEHFAGAKQSELGTNEPGLFSNATTYGQLADMIDMAFANNLHLQKGIWFNYQGIGYREGNSMAWASTTYFTQFLCWHIEAFSKFNIGAVWYYYDLWQFNFIVGFAGVLVCTTIFINIILGLMTRLFMCIVLFLVNPPLFGLAPMDGGKAGKSWQTEFMKQVLMTYGAVVGMNLMLMILPYMNTIDFFNIPIADYFARTLLIIVGLITIKAVIATLSGLIGAADANKTGGDIAGEVGKVAGQATRLTLGAAKVGAKATGFALKPVTAGLGAGANAIKNSNAGQRIANYKFAKGVGTAIDTVKEHGLQNSLAMAGNAILKNARFKQADKADEKSRTMKALKDLSISNDQAVIINDAMLNKNKKEAIESIQETLGITDSKQAEEMYKYAKKYGFNGTYKSITAMKGEVSRQIVDEIFDSMIYIYKRELKDHYEDTAYWHMKND